MSNVIFTYDDGQVDVIQQSRLDLYLKRMFTYDGEEFSRVYYCENGEIKPLVLRRVFLPFDQDDYATVNFGFLKPNGEVWADGSYTVDGRV